MPAWLPGAIIGFLSLILTLAIFQSNRKQQGEQIALKAFTDLVEKVNLIQHWQAGVDVKIGIFWQGVKYDAMSAAKILHQPHAAAAEMDALIDKYLTGHLKSAELKRFIGLLEATRDDANGTEVRRLAAAQMLRALNQEFQLMEVQRALDSMTTDRQAGLVELGHVLDAGEQEGKKK